MNHSRLDSRLGVHVTYVRSKIWPLVRFGGEERLGEFDDSNKINKIKY